MQLEASLGYNLDFVSKKGGRGHDQNSKFFTEEIEEVKVHLLPKTKMLRDLNWIHFFFLTPDLKQPRTIAS